MRLLIQVCECLKFGDLPVALSIRNESATLGLALPLTHVGQEVVASYIVYVAEATKTFIKGAKGIWYSKAMAGMLAEI